jgi:hypothetical protein
MTWKELTEHMAEARPHSNTAAITKKPLRFKTKEGRMMKLKKQRWRYALLSKALREDRQHAEEEERALLLHDTPLTRSQVRAYQRNSGSTYPHAMSPSKSCTMGVR